MTQPKDNAAYLRQWAADIRRHSGKSVDADRCDAMADEIDQLRARIRELEAERDTERDGAEMWKEAALGRGDVAAIRAKTVEEVIEQVDALDFDPGIMMAIVDVIRALNQPQNPPAETER